MATTVTNDLLDTRQVLYGEIDLKVPKTIRYQVYVLSIILTEINKIFLYFYKSAKKDFKPKASDKKILIHAS